MDLTLDHDASGRLAIQNALDQSLLVEAAAGTGKTTQLVARLLALLRSGRAEIDQIVAVTFTRKAAGELKLRLRQELERGRSEATGVTERSYLERAISRLEEARIGTIHSFCAEILRERPVEARVDPAFEELSEEEGPRLYERAFKTWIQEKLNQMPETLRRCLSRLATWSSIGQSTPLDRIRDAGWTFIEWRDFNTFWRREPFEREAEIDILIPRIFTLAEASAQCRYEQDYLRRSLAPARLFKEAVERTEAVRARDYDDLEARLLDLLRGLERDKRKGRGFFAENATRQQVVAMRSEVMDLLQNFRMRADADLAAGLQREFQSLVEGYEELKRRSGSLDFVDLLICARDLLWRNHEVRGYFQQRFSHIFVDEVQDTDPLQAEIILLLCADSSGQNDWTQVQVVPGKLFMVGDPKQSIYRFRRADVLLYQEIKKILLSAGVRLVHLSQNFRSVKTIQQAVNAAFGEVMDDNQEVGQPAYVPLLEHLPARADQPSVIALPVPEPYGYSQISRMKVAEGLPDTAGAFIDWLLQESGWKVRDPDDPASEIPIQPRHVCLLFRRFMSWGQDVTRPYVRALEARGVPHLLVGSRSFHQREEVETLRAALTAVEWPDDELAVYATLKGSFFAISDNLLFLYSQKIGRLYPFARRSEDPEEQFLPIHQGLDLLAALHRRRNFRPIVQTINEILEFTRAHAGCALRPSGEQVLSNIQRICDMARAFEIRGGISFRGFVEQLAHEAQNGRSAEAPVLEEGAEGVRIMTLHSAKGLEFPVVLLADITAGLASREPEKYVDLAQKLCAARILYCSPWELIENQELEQKRNEAEGVRVAYVAATRARDLLIVPTVGDKELEGGWISPLNKAVYPRWEESRESAPGPGCPAFGDRSVLFRPPSLDSGYERSVKPGLHSPQIGEHRVVWWDPAVLRLSAEPNFGLRREEVLVEDLQEAAHETGWQQYLQWHEKRNQALLTGSRPRFELVNASETTHLPPGDQLPLRIETLARASERPSGRRFGTLVHTVLRDVEMTAARTQIESLCRYHSRILEATPEELSATTDAVIAVLEHPLLERARLAGRCHRELPLSLNLDDGRTLEGTIDLAFFDDDAWTIVDFKTDADLKRRQQHYQRQVQWYVFAVSKIMNSSARGCLLVV